MTSLSFFGTGGFNHLYMTSFVPVLEIQRLHHEGYKEPLPYYEPFLVLVYLVSRNMFFTTESILHMLQQKALNNVSHSTSNK